MTDSDSDAAGGLAPVDPFAEARAAGGYLGDFMGEAIPVLVGWRAVRAAAKDWGRFSNDAPGRVPIPAEDDVRSLRQLPIEADPPLHGRYKDLVKGWFRRPLEDAALIARLDGIVDRHLAATLDAGTVDAVGRVALPIQSHALAALLGLPEAEAEEWIGWGTHAFRAAGRNDPARAAALMAMLERHVDHARAEGGDDFFGHMAALALDGRALTRDEMLGFAHVAFAGGRDTVINTLASAMAHLAHHPADLARLRDEPGLVARAGEEIVRHTAALTHIGRVCTREDVVAGHARRPGERVALCWAAASFDPEAFADAETLRIDRSPNPHVAFGAGDHACLGAAHARAVLRSLLLWLAARVGTIEPVDVAPGTRSVGGILRRHGFERLRLRFRSREL